MYLGLGLTCAKCSLHPVGGGEAAKFGLTVGDAMGLTTGWGFNNEEDCKRAEEYMDENEPQVLIGSPPCVAFSQF